MYCKQCGNEVKPGARYCGNCGAEVLSPSVRSTASRIDVHGGGYAVPQTIPKKKRGWLVAIIIGASVIIIGLVFVFLIYPQFAEKSGGEVEIQKESLNGDFDGGIFIVCEADVDVTDSQSMELMEQTKSIIERRCIEMGIHDGRISIEGENRIRIELPGGADEIGALVSICQTGYLQFQTADGAKILDSSDIKNSGAEFNEQFGAYEITLEFTDEGQEKFLKGTTAASSRKLPVKTNEDGSTWTLEGNTIEPDQILILIDDEVISSPSATKPIDSSSAVITGNFTMDEANRLSLLIRSALPVALEEIESGILGFEAPVESVPAIASSDLEGTWSSVELDSNGVSSTFIEFTFLPDNKIFEREGIIPGEMIIANGTYSLSENADEVTMILEFEGNESVAPIDPNPINVTYAISLSGDALVLLNDSVELNLQRGKVDFDNSKVVPGDYFP
jgi:preprotein translocase subunit SecD